MTIRISRWSLGLLAVSAIGLFLLWAAGVALGQDGPLAPTETLASQITYQGSLIESGQPVNGSRDMLFRLFSDSLCTGQVGSDIVKNGVQVEDSFFTVFLDVNQANFDGQSLWLEVTVAGTALGCQPIAAAPYALSLRPGALIRGSTSSANGLLELESSGPGQAIRATATDGMILYGSTGGGPAVYGYASGGYGLRGVSSASGFAAVRGDTSTLNTLGGDFYSQESSGVSGVTASVKATPVPGVSDTYVAGVRGVAQSSGYVYGVYAESQAGNSGAGLYAANSGFGTYAPDIELAGGSNGNGVLASDRGVGQSSSNLVLLSNDDISLHLNDDSSIESSQFEILDGTNASVFTVDDAGNTVGQGVVTGENGLSSGDASGDGLFIYRAGSYLSSGVDGAANGVEVRSADNDGLMVGANGGDGVDIWNAAGKGIYVRGAGSHGVYVQDAGADNYFAGDTGIGVDPPSTRLHVRDSINGAASLPNHTAVIENASTGISPDVLVIKIGEVKNGDGSNIDGGNNFISFMDGGNSSLGAIQGNGSGGVVLAGPGNDYAEYLPRRSPQERIAPGDVVGVVNGKVSRNTAGADLVLAASTGAIVAGNDPGQGRRQAYSLVAFVGQVNVRVRGPVAAGDFILPSGLNDGTGIAVAPEALDLDQLPSVLGQAWESSDDPGVKQVRTFVGLVQPQAISQLLQDVSQRLEAIEAALDLAAED